VKFTGHKRDFSLFGQSPSGMIGIVPYGMKIKSTGCPCRKKGMPYVVHGMAIEITGIASAMKETE
jgi:hypothetical protein